MMPKQREKENSASQQHNVAQYLSMLAVPAMYLFFKYSEYKKQKQRSKTVTEKELDNLNQRINKLLAKIDTTENDTSQSGVDEECVICFSAKATIHTFPCSHKVVCRKCFIKTIQMAVSQRCLPLQCVVCRARILKLRQESSIKKPKKSCEIPFSQNIFSKQKSSKSCISSKLIRS